MRYFLITMNDNMFAEAKALVEGQGMRPDTDANVIRELIEFHELDVVEVSEQ